MPRTAVVAVDVNNDAIDATTTIASDNPRLISVGAVYTDDVARRVNSDTTTLSAHHVRRVIRPRLMYFSRKCASYRRRRRE